MDDVQHDIEELKAVLHELAAMAKDAADPGITPAERIEKIRLMKPLWERHDDLLARIKEVAGF